MRDYRGKQKMDEQDKKNSARWKIAQDKLVNNFFQISRKKKIILYIFVSENCKSNDPSIKYPVCKYQEN